MGKTSRRVFSLWTVPVLISSFMMFTSCGSPSKENVIPLPANVQSQQPAATQSAAEPDQADNPTTQSGLSVTQIRKEEDGKYSATLNNAIVFKDLEISKDDSGKELLFFPKTPGRDDKKYHIVYLEDRSIAFRIKDAIKAGKAVGTGAPGVLKVTGVKWNALDREGKVKGFADVTFNNAFTIKGCKLIDGKNGLWMAWPSVKKGDKYDDLVFAIDKGVRDMVEAAVKKESGL